MASILEHVAARIAFAHAGRVYRRFRRTLRDVDAAQNRALGRALEVVRHSDFGRRYGLARVRCPADLRRATPLTTYEDLRPYVDRLADGDLGALLSPGQRLLMFALSSGTTALPKRIPVTAAFAADYRRGWNTFGLRMLADHPDAILRSILQCTGRHDVQRTAGGTPCGAITGLLAQMQKGIVRRFYVGRPELAHLECPAARYYALMRLGMGRDVAFAVTANPATLIEMARTADEHGEELIRDVRDGSLSARIVTDEAIRRRLAVGLRRDAARALELTRLRRSAGALRPRDYWNLSFIACWTGGSMGHYLQRLADWWGDRPARDIGLLASEGRVTLPLEDGTPAGVLDVTAGVFEFIPAAELEAPEPAVLGPRELETGRDFGVVLTNTAGLVRYRLDDVVRVRGWMDGAPVLEFLYRGGRVASVTGEKLTENQVVAAVQLACKRLGIRDLDFLLAPCWSDPPFYRLSCTEQPASELVAEVDRALGVQNDEYASRRKSRRLGSLELRVVGKGDLAAMDRRLIARRESVAEQYKRPCLFTSPGDDDVALGIDTPATVQRSRQ